MSTHKRPITLFELLATIRNANKQTTIDAIRIITSVSVHLSTTDKEDIILALENMLGFEYDSDQTKYQGSLLKEIENIPAPKSIQACNTLIQAYKSGEENDGSIEWSDIDTAYELAQDALNEIQ